MSDLFKVTYYWEKRATRLDFDEGNYADATELFLGLERFLATNQGHFVVYVDDFDLHFDLDPDLSTIFEELPEVLGDLTAETELPVELHFYEQGTDLIFLLERKGDTITIRFAKGPSVGKRFAHVPERTLAVPADVFIDQWVRFAQAILEGLVTLQPELKNDQSYQAYSGRVDLLQDRT